MNNEEIKTAGAVAPLLGTPLAPFVMVGGVGVLGYLLYKKFKKNGLEPSGTDESTVEETVQSTVQTVKPTVQETVSEQLNEPSETVQKIPMYTYTEDSMVETEDIEEEIETSEPQPTDEEIKKEVLRQAMSELGKRSGEARRKKKLE